MAELKPACCSPQVLAACCTPEAKADCCGDDSAPRCGCEGESEPAKPDAGADIRER